MLSFENKDGRILFKDYYLPNVEIIDFNALIDYENFFDYEKIIDYTIGNLMDYEYFSRH